ncbi:MAG: ATP-binding protein [Candidatus Bathyarchaeia archaeon]
MKIKTRLWISAILTICMVIAIGLTISYMSQQVNDAYEKHNAVDEIVEGAFKLNILTGDYLTHQEERAQTQWNLVHEHQTNHLAGLELKNHAEQSYLDRIRQNHESTKDIFSQVVALYEEQETSGEKNRLRDILVAQLSVKLQDMVSDASLLSEAYQERYLRAYEMTGLLVMVFVIVIVVGVGVNAFYIITTIAKPIADLHHGVEMIRSGNLDHKVGTSAENEIGQLSRDFDQMTEELKEYSENLEDMVEKRTKDLRDTQEELTRHERLATLGQLAGGVAHELRNPLGAIKNSAYFLNLVLENTEPDVTKSLDVINKEVDTSEKIINSLLEFARIRRPNRVKVDINTTLQDTLTRIQRPENIEIDLNLEDNLPKIMADAVQLTQIFTNITLNAFQAMPRGGELKIETSTPDPESVAIAISDTGIGISEDNISKIFEPLFTTKAKGIGLGLAITKNLVEGHQGSISVSSEEGKGTTFTVRFPLRGESTE